jgi:L-2-hydroxyglutarate oxidase
MSSTVSHPTVTRLPTSPADFLVVGGGLVGLATAYQLLGSRPGARVVVLEKEPLCGLHQSTHNSGVLHCGLYYKPGSAKARLAVEGIREITDFCREENIPHEICGKLVVATDATEVERLKKLQERGAANGLAGLRWLDAAQAREIEPHARAVAALHVPQEGIVDYAAVVSALVRRIRAAGGEVVNSARVLSARATASGWVIETTLGAVETRFLVNCGGLHSDRVARLAGSAADARIVPFRGEYFKLRAGRRHLVKHLIYPVPDPAFPFLGVHFTRLIGGGVEAGPNAVLAFKREGYRKTDFSPRDLWDAATFPGLWRFLAKHPGMCAHELWRSLWRPAFCRALQKLVPEIREEDLEPGGAGVRAQAMSAGGALVEDFRFVAGPRALHVLNAPSPAATASLAIGRGVVARLDHGLSPANRPLATAP